MKAKEKNNQAMRPALRKAAADALPLHGAKASRGNALHRGTTGGSTHD
jgi:hypothetical protein